MEYAIEAVALCGHLLDWISDFKYFLSVRKLSVYAKLIIELEFAVVNSD